MNNYHIFLVTGMLAASTLFAAPAGDGKTHYRVIAVSRTDQQVMSISNEVAVDSDFGIYIPNAFTPNGDGLNDTFGISGEGVGACKMEVYDRWGEQIFTSDDPSNRWDGTYMGQPVQSGTYVYRVKATSADGLGAFTKDGTVTLIK